MEQSVVKIIIKNANYGCIAEAPFGTLKILKSEFTFLDKSKMFGARRTGVKFDPNVRFISDKTNKFLLGLLPEICASLDKLEVPYKIFKQKDCQKNIEIDESLICDTLVTPRGCPLRDDQLEFIKRYAKYRRGIVQAATGFGKTAVMAGILKIIKKGTPGLVIINSVDLINQTYDEFIKFGISPDELGVFTGQKKDPKTITLTTVNSLPNLEEMLPHMRFFLADEVHDKCTSAKSKLWIKKMVNATDRIAFSATPFKKGDLIHEHRLRGMFGPVLGVAKSKDLQEKGILSAANVFFHKVPRPKKFFGDEHMVYQEAYNKFVVYNDDFHDIAADLITSLKGRTVIFVERKDHGLEIMKRIPGAIWVSGDDKKDFRKDTIQKLKESPEDTPVISTRIFKTGVDIYVHNVVNLSAMAAEHGVIQGFGRGLRLAPDKDHCDYHDFIFEQNTHLLKHSKRRIAALKKEGHNITILDDYA